MKCPECQSTKYVKFGLKKLRAGSYQQYQCGKCYRIFRSTKRIKKS